MARNPNKNAQKHLNVFVAVSAVVLTNSVPTCFVVGLNMHAVAETTIKLGVVFLLTVKSFLVTFSLFYLRLFFS